MTAASGYISTMFKHHYPDHVLRRTLSSPLTFFWKFAATPLLAGAYVWVMAAEWSDGWKHRDGTPASMATMAFVIVCLATAVAWLVWLSTRLKRVAVDDCALYVSNYVTEIRVPLSEVTDVRESGTLRWFLIGVDLRSPTTFGQHLHFRPRLRLYWSGLHPMARELKKLADQASAEPGEERAGAGHTAIVRTA